MGKFVNERIGVIDNIREYVQNWVNKHPVSEIHIGCDSQEVTGKVNYVTTICLYELGKGAHVLYKKEHVPTISNMYTKLWDEVVKAVQTAEDLKDIGPRIVIHVDYNSDKGEKSNRLYDSGIGYAKSFGFDAVGKPNAWAATHAADNYCR